MEKKNYFQSKEEIKEKSLREMSRRTFLKSTGIAFIAMFALGGAGVLAKGKPLLRPPGGQNEDEFLARCIRCGRCRSICHTSAITAAKITDGIVEARTPTMNYSHGYCDFCKECVEVCPTGALKEFDTDSVKIGTAVVQKDICLAWVKGGCTICSQKCPFDAIRLDENRRPVVDEEKCNGCGVCEYECAAFVLRSYVGGKNRGIVVRPSSSTGGILARLLAPVSGPGGNQG